MTVQPIGLARPDRVAAVSRPRPRYAGPSSRSGHSAQVRCRCSSWVTAYPCWAFIRLRSCSGRWIPAFAGMTAMAFGATPCRVVTPAFAGMTAQTQLMSFPRRRESIGYRQPRMPRPRTHQPPAPLPSFPRRRESIGYRRPRMPRPRTHQPPAPLPSFPRRRESIGYRRPRMPRPRTHQPPAPLPSFPRRRESIGYRRPRMPRPRTHQPPAPLPSFPRRRESIRP